MHLRPVEETIIDWALTMFQLGLASPEPKQSQAKLSDAAE